MIVRRIDELGRVVIPAEYRREMHLEANDEIGMLFENGEVIIRPVKHQCRMCGAGAGRSPLVPISSGAICRSCVAEAVSQ